MPIYVYLDVDIESVRECAAALDKVAESAESGFEGFRRARDRSEAVWDSDAGVRFRTTITTLATGAEQTSDRASALAEALRTFADSMLTAREQMNRAIARAIEAGVRIGPDICNATWIDDPQPLHPTGPWTIKERTTQANQISAYNDAIDMVTDSRNTETSAHDALLTAFDDSQGWLDRLRDAAPWMAAGGVISYLGTAAQQADQWGSIAQTRVAQVERFATLAAEATSQPVSTAAATAASKFGPSADDAIRIAAQNRALLPGSALPKLGQWAATALPYTGEIGKKIPMAGAFLTSVQTAYDLRDAEDAGDVAKIVAKDAGGFLAGTAATTLLLGSVAGARPPSPPWESEFSSHTASAN